MAIMAISEESQPDGMRNSSYPLSQIILTHMESHFINQPSITQQKLQLFFFLGMKSKTVLYNIFSNVQERTKETESVVAFGDI